MNWFLDMNIVIYYCFRTGHFLESKAIKFVNNKGKNRFIICFYITKKNLPGWIQRQGILIKEIKRKINDPSYVLWTSKESGILLEKDKISGEKIIKKYNLSKDKNRFITSLERSWIYTESRINLFIKNYIDEEVISLEEIDPQLRSNLLIYLDNNSSDANTIASGIQAHNKNELTMITSDKNHWTKNNLEWAIPPVSPLEKKYPKIPEIKYLQDF
jgi:hypothetical protein